MKLVESIRTHYIQILPPTIFFLISFGLLFATKQLILREFGMSFTGVGIAVAGAILVGKIVLMIDKFPFVDKFPNKPLIYNTCWKSGIYFLASIVIRCIRQIAPLLLKHESLSDATAHFVDTTVWPEFWLIQMWLAVLFFAFCAGREFVRVMGGSKIVELFFGFGSKSR
jgi:hypothetical protein